MSYKCPGIPNGDYSFDHGRAVWNKIINYLRRLSEKLDEDIVDATADRRGMMTAADKDKLDGVEPGAEVNQNAFSAVKVGSSTIEADGKTDVLELAAGTGIELTVDTTTDTMTIGGVEATTTAAGLMSATDKSKLDRIEAGAEVNQNAFSNVKIGTVTVAADSKTDTINLGVGAGIIISANATYDGITIGCVEATQSIPGIMSTTDKTKLDGISAATATPLPHGAGEVGVSSKYAREDHRHPLERFGLVGQVDFAGSDVWYKIASCQNATVNSNREIVFYVNDTHPTSNCGVLKINARSDSNAEYIEANVKFLWLVNSGYDSTDFIVVIPTTDPSSIEVWTRLPADFQRRSFTVITEGTSADRSSVWTLYRTYTQGGVNAPTSGIQITPTYPQIIANATTTTNGLMSSTDKSKLDGISAGAEVNQHAFAIVKVGATSVTADAKQDTLNLVEGSNVTISPNATTDTITISATDTVYTHPTTSGNKHIPAGGSSGQILRWSADGTAEWGADTDTVYTHPSYTAQTGKPTADQTPAFGDTVTISQIVSDTTGHVVEANDKTIKIPATKASSTADGLMSKEDKADFDEINIAANKDVVFKYIAASTGNQNNYPYHLIAKSGVITSFGNLRSITLVIDGRRPSTGFGIVKIDVRTGNNANQNAQCSAEWIIRNSNMAADAIQIGFRNVSGDCICDIFIKSPNTYRDYVCKVLSEGASNNMSGVFSLQNAIEVNNTTASDSLTSENVYSSISDANAALYTGKPYTSTITPQT